MGKFDSYPLFMLKVTYHAGGYRNGMRKTKALNRIKHNPIEREVQLWFLSRGYNSLSSGWPDFCFFREESGKIEAVFVEVKKFGQTRIKPNQEYIRRILASKGIKMLVAYGMKGGRPNFKEK